MSATPHVARTRSLPLRLLSPAVHGAREAFRRARGLPEIHRLIHRVRPFTMVGDEDLIGLAETVKDLEHQGIEGAFVECGTWRGGSSFLMALLAPSRRVWMFDSFEGLPVPSAEDGAAGAAWGPEHPWWQDNVRADIEDVRRSAARLGVSERCEIVKGWFSDTLPQRHGGIGPIALLRLDGDLYESTKTCLETLWDHVVPGGAVILDDYYWWDGTARATHEFLGARGLGCPIRPLGSGNAIIRTPPRETDHGQATVV